MDKAFKAEKNLVVSILVVCHGSAELTRQCLESVAAHTRIRHEMIVVDNGSQDDTPHVVHAAAQVIKGRRTVVLRNEQNRGYPAACNQALAQVQGDVVCFLNNDTLVTQGWLERMLTHLAAPGVGLVGPMSNAVPDPQRVPADQLAGRSIEKVGQERAARYAGQFRQVTRLSGFCMLVRRSVMDRIGPLDEQFGLGFFDDDDLCFRAADAGFTLRIAMDVFVHHHGSQTFKTLNVDTQKLLQDNFAKFRAKWGVERTTGYRLPSPSKGGTGEAPRARVTLCMIVKNEEGNLADCLTGARDLFDEIVIVDTGSSDRTKDIARELGAKVVDYPWSDSFAAARNVSLDHATGDYVFWLDADDRLNEDNRAKLRELFTSLHQGDRTAFVMKCRCLPRDVGETETVVDHIRLFPRLLDLRWRYRVHEQIMPALRKAGCQVQWAAAAVDHVGYQNPDLRGRKLERDLRLLQLDQKDLGEEPFVLFNLGQVLSEMGQQREALAALQRSLELSHPADSIVRKIYALIARLHDRLSEHELALAACRKGREFYPDDAELLYTEAGLREAEGDVAGAALLLERLLDAREGAHFASVNTALRGSATRDRLATLKSQLAR
jgi:glycosyltransferase involved in cell wall biosynthesis